MVIRLATPADVPALLAIYAPYVRDTAATFEYDVPTHEAFAARVAAIQTQYPYLVAEVAGRVLGYAYASRHRERAAYAWSVEVSVYVHPDGQRQGLARQLYTQLLERLAGQGFVNAYAVITLPNPASEQLHRSMGFRPVGVFDRVGYKFGTWYSTCWLQRARRPHPDESWLPAPGPVQP